MLPLTKEQEAALGLELATKRQEHADLDAAIHTLIASGLGRPDADPAPQEAKLALKDRIVQLENILIPTSLLEAKPAVRLNARFHGGSAMLTTPPVAIVMGSQSDWPTMRHAAETLDTLEIEYEARIVSAHRTPDAWSNSPRRQGRGLQGDHRRRRRRGPPARA